MSDTEMLAGYARLTAKQRYEQLIEQTRKAGALWTLSDEQGCLIVDTEKEKVLLVFASEQLAKAWAEQDHPSFAPLSIPVEMFIEKWAPGMSNDGFDVAVAPSMAGEGTIVSPGQLAEELSTGKIG
ncbi:DUF2750 domain-containing protein [Aliagarivorans taiwanensis]|uniref:DUF2750 domain-containing protein n=1 Tax=Aliagarivorans taiwanensis TaxID=561966 RepID=UPI0004222EE8|nr:DUF2750 domain-containing protein [Aliagarivorans taiwanensis]